MIKRAGWLSVGQTVSYLLEREHENAAVGKQRHSCLHEPNHLRRRGSTLQRGGMVGNVVVYAVAPVLYAASRIQPAQSDRRIPHTWHATPAILARADVYAWMDA
jgi:hypothetical protein